MNAETPTEEQLSKVRQMLELEPTATDAEVIGVLVNMIGILHDQNETLRQQLQPFGGVQFIVH